MLPDRSRDVYGRDKPMTAIVIVGVITFLHGDNGTSGSQAYGRVTGIFRLGHASRRNGDGVATAALG
jgi:hypothetical protein